MGTLSFENGKFYYSANTHRDLAAVNAGFKMDDAGAFRWVTRSAAKAVKLRRFADESGERKLKNTFITSLTPPESIQYPDHLEPRSWQMTSAWHALTRTPSFIADEAGLGKTITACLCMNSAPGKALIICPPFLKYNWANEISKWATPHTTCPLPAIVEGPDADFNRGIVIVPDSLIARKTIQDEIAKHSFKWLFVDEFHRFKTEDAQRTVALLGDENHEGIVSRAERLVFMSGTPIPNGRPIELFGLLSRVAPEAMGFRCRQTYGKDFCAAKPVTHYERGKAVVHWDFSGASNLKQLRKELKAKFMVRHLKKDVLTELGPKTRQVVFLDRPKRFEKLDQALLQNRTIEELLGENSNLGDIATYRKECGLAKLLPAVAFIKSYLDNTDEKVVVFAHHISVVNELHRYLGEYGALKVQGGMTAKEKQDAVTQFQSRDVNRVIVGNIDSIGVGNTLTKAPRAIFVEASWSPGINEQAEDRIHRITQDKHVYIQYLVLRDSLDERILNRVLEKEKHIHEALN